MRQNIFRMRCKNTYTKIYTINKKYQKYLKNIHFVIQHSHIAHLIETFFCFFFVYLLFFVTQTMHFVSFLYIFCDRNINCVDFVEYFL